MMRRVFDSVHSTLGWSFAVFTFASAFSIALAQMSLGVALICFVILVFGEGIRPWRRPLMWFYRLMAAYVLWLAVSAVVGRTPLGSLEALREEWLFTIIPVAVYLLQQDRWRRILMRCLACGVTLAAIYALSQLVAGHDWLLHHEVDSFGGKGLRLTGLFGYSLTFGNYMVTASTFLLGVSAASLRDRRSREGWWLFAASLLGVFVVAIANSRGPVVALAASLVAFGWLFRKLKYIIAVGVVGLLAAFVVEPGVIHVFTQRVERDMKLNNERGRLAIFNNSLKIIRDHPVTGVGLGNFEAEYATHISDSTNEILRMKHAHNDLLNVAAVSGFPALVFFVGMWIFVLRSEWRLIRLKGIPPPYRQLALGALVASVAFIVASMTEATFADEEVRQCIMFVWAAGLTGWFVPTNEQVDI